MIKLKRSECAILHLTLRGIWYGMILHGDKREEYRDYKRYWIIRLVNWWDKFRLDGKHLVVAFSRGRTKADLFFRVSGNDILARDGVAKHPEWGEPRTPHFVLVLGERVELIDESGVANG